MKALDKVLVVVAAAFVLGPLPAWSQGLSGSTSNSTGATCSGGASGDGDCRNSTQPLTNTAATFKSRYAWNINADTGIFSTHDTSGSARHNVTFNATAPGGYRLDISTQRTGDIRLINDLAGCSGSADTSGITGSSNIALNSGTLTLGDPGGIGTTGTDTDVPFNQTSSASIFRVSNGVAQSHSLSFTWNGAVRSNSCEAAVRQGESSGTTTGCSACGYPGNPSRTSTNDGHFVTVTFTSLCGNGTIDSSVSEQCDLGSANGAFGSCCSSNCTFTSSSTTCRNSAGTCDVAETCTGTSAACPGDGFVSSTAVCRSSAGACDVAEHCTGTSAACPGDSFLSNTSVCRSSAGACDVAENCTGTSAACPADGFASSTVTCRSSAGVCDLAEHCTGTGVACPADAKSTAVCRSSAGSCDVAESCDGVNNNCPADGFQASTVVCRAAAGACDVAENCTGGSAACPADAFEASTVTCRPATGACDVAENCTGSGATCPPDSVAGAFVQCRAAAGVCDLPENCDGTNKNCPADAVKPSTVVCRAAAGTCDVAENCDGSSVNCPSDAFQSATAVCRPASGACDVAENCTGSGANCPADAFQPATVECRASAGVCDVAENCTGGSAACPADTFQPSTVTCRASVGVCDAAESCTGSSASCPPDSVAGSFVECRAASGPCDQAENCTGSTNTCPPDAVKTIGTVCRTATDICDLAEVCDGSSKTCPTDLAAPDGTPCDDNNSCSSPDTCQGGVCVGTPQPQTCADHYLCYKTKPASVFVPVPNVHLVDQFEDIHADVTKVRTLCPPADKNAEGIVDDVTHLESYNFRAISGTPSFVRRTHVRLDNQLGTIYVDAYKRDLLLVPTNKSLSGPATPPDNNTINVDHFKCYKAKVTPGTPRFTPTTVSVGDQFTSPPKNLLLKKIKHLCTPVDTNGQGFKNPDAHLACYQAKPASGQPKHQRRTGVNTANEFGTLVLGTVKESEFCIPSLKTLGP